jgi:hypothetical protein
MHTYIHSYIHTCLLRQKHSHTYIHTTYRLPPSLSNGTTVQIKVFHPPLCRTQEKDRVFGTAGSPTS